MMSLIYGDRHGQSAANIGQSATEYGLILVLLAAVSIGALTSFGVSLQDMYCGLIGSLGGEPAACTGSEIWAENFDNLDAWNITDGKKWDDEEGELCVGPGGEHRGFTGGDDWDDYTVNVDRANLDHGDGYGVYFRVNDEPDINGYVFQYDPGYRGGSYPNGAFLIRKVVNGGETSPIAAQPAPDDFDWYDVDRQVSVEVEGDTFTAFVDGEQVVQATDSQFATGRVGLRTWDGSLGCFDDLTVTR
jgi:Flp pilus assembly pilin Flp